MSEELESFPVCHKGFPCDCFCHTPGVRSFAGCDCCQRCAVCGVNYVETVEFNTMGIHVKLVPPE